MNHAGAVALDDIARRIERTALIVGESPELVDLPKTPNAPRWKVSERWIEFECGCRAERVPLSARFSALARHFDPVIFRGLPQQAVYEGTCDFHAPSMNVYVHFGGFHDFKQWKERRRAVLMGRTYAA